MKYLMLLLIAVSLASCSTHRKTKDKEESIVIDPIVVEPIEEKKENNRGGMKECQKKLESKDKALMRCNKGLDLCKDMYEAPEPKYGW